MVRGRGERPLGGAADRFPVPAVCLAGVLMPRAARPLVGGWCGLPFLPAGSVLARLGIQPAMTFRKVAAWWGRAMLQAGQVMKSRTLVTCRGDVGLSLLQGKRFSPVSGVAVVVYFVRVVRGFHQVLASLEECMWVWLWGVVSTGDGCRVEGVSGPGRPERKRGRPDLVEEGVRGFGPGQPARLSFGSAVTGAVCPAEYSAWSEAGCWPVLLAACGSWCSVCS